MVTKQVKIISFDQTEVLECESIRPENSSELLKLKGKSLLARGAGLSYCAASASQESIVVDMSSMNKILNFNPDELLVEVESGISIGELNNFLLKKGYVLPVLPGYPTISIGGCVAFNVHGKSNFQSGTFSSLVQEFKILHHSLGELKCSVYENEELFNLTIGGMGLTGIILSVKLSFRILPGGKLRFQRVRCSNLIDAVRIMNDSASQHEFVYSWNNLNLQGEKFGGGFVYLENFAAGILKTTNYKNKLNPLFRSPIHHSDFSIRCMCQIYSWIEGIRSEIKTVELDQSSFPIYNKEIYYQLFGQKGFREYQMIIPISQVEITFEKIRRAIAKHNVSVSLGSLKLFNGKSMHLRFDGEGVCLALDVRNCKSAMLFFQELDMISLECGAIVNLSKDSRLTADMISKTFPEYEIFKMGIKKYDPDGMIKSVLKTRLMLEV